ncbi:protein LDOC1-like [Rana temporaria]|uniref:protein LDOC1-like n=1 Tax=Rana temporaria TaxID=8407 RepID=UPI001AAC7E15|nr:protein LDOC1-like [Rana temporaria]
MEAVIAAAVAPLRVQITKLQTFAVNYQEKCSELQIEVKALQEDILELNKQLRDFHARDTAAVDTNAQMPLPLKFNGDHRHYRGFLNQCCIYFQMQPAAFTSERKKVLFIINLLTEEALAWASPYVEKDDVVLDDFDSFVTAMNQVFDDPNRCATAD